MRCCHPILVAVPQGALAFWEGEWGFWAGDTDLMVWAGSNSSRAALVDHELWLAPTSLDSRSCLRARDHLPARVHPWLCPLQPCFRDAENIIAEGSQAGLLSN